MTSFRRPLSGTDSLWTCAILGRARLSLLATPWMRLLLGLAVRASGALLLACTPAVATPPSGSQLPANWTTRSDPSGFVVSYPKGWSVASDPKTGRVDVSQGSSSATILPFVTNQQLGNTQAAAVFTKLAPTATPGITWQQPVSPSAGVVRTTGSGQDRRAIGLLTWANGSSLTAGYLYVGSARPQDFDTESGTFAQIFQSFHVQGKAANGGGSAPALQFVPWRDPREGAFSVEIPKGWKAEGGAFRPASDVVLAAVNVSSPDGKIALYLGNYPYLIYREPDPVTTSVYPVGSRISLPDGYQTQVEPFMPATQFLTQVVLPGRKLTQLNPGQPQERPDIASALPNYNGIARYSAAETDYQFVRNGQQYRGHAVCIVEEDRGMPTLWKVWRVTLFEAPADRYDEGAAASAHLTQSYVIDTGWAQRQSQTALQQAQTWNNAGQHINQLITQGFAGRQDVLNRNADRADKVIQGKIDVTDPTTHTQFRVDNGSNYYWIDKSGQIAGTNTNSKPNVDFRQLVINPQQ